MQKTLTKTDMINIITDREVTRLLNKDRDALLEEYHSCGDSIKKYVDITRHIDVVTKDALIAVILGFRTGGTESLEQLSEEDLREKLGIGF